MRLFKAILARRAVAVMLATAVGCRASEDKSDEAPQIETASSAISVSFATGSLVIPMDTTYQDDGTLRAFGLVYQLLLHGIPVHWAVRTGKAQGDADFTATATDLQTGNAIPSHGYRAGPFIIDSSNRAAALPIINAWQMNNTTAVHSLTSVVTADIRHHLRAAPRIAVFVDTFETIAFNYFNAAGIPDSTGQAWPTAIDPTGMYAGFPDVLTEAEVAGATNMGAADGALMNSDGTQHYCQLTSMHYGTARNEVVREVRLWLTAGAGAHAFMECAAASSFENNRNGHFLTSAGVQNDGLTPNPDTNLHPDSAFAQYDGGFQATGGLFHSLGLQATSTFFAPDTPLINLTGATDTTRVVWLTGFVDGLTSKGKVSYLTGHDYGVALPISTNPLTNGARLFLDSMLESPCTYEQAAPSLSLSKSAPAMIAGSSITFTLSWTNGGPGTAESAVLTDALPPGTTFVSATGGGTFAAGTVTWDLGNIAAGAAGTVSFTVSVTMDGTYSNQARINYNVSLTAFTLLSNSTMTVRNTGMCSAGNTSSCMGRTPVCNTTIDMCVPCSGDFGSGAMFPCPSANAPACEPNGSCGRCSPTNRSLCTGTMPTCDLMTDTCAECNGDNGSSASRPCPTAIDPACEPNGSCGQCSSTDHMLCTGMTPACNLSTDMCGPCNGDFGSGASRACPTQGAPACEPNGTCTQCSSSNHARCNGTTPACDLSTDMCGACNGDFGSGASRACPSSAAPACEPTGACGQCSQTDPGMCMGTTPLCNVATGQCAGCNGDFGSGASRACPTQGAPACEPSGACGQCSAQDQLLCMGNTPVCNATLGMCGACNGNFGSGASRACPTQGAPACETSGACGQCSASDQVLCTGTTPVCDTTLGMCEACNGDSGSGASHACRTGAAPACESTGACGQCSRTDQGLCTGMTPVCNTSVGMCGPCTSDFGSGMAGACPTMNAPACEPTGACGQCSASDQILCMGTTPLCNVAAGTCAGCNGNNGSGASRACPSSGAPACEPSGACGQCSASDQVLCMGTTPVCNVPLGMCGACNGDFGSGASRACPSSGAPACEASGACGQCSASNGTLCTGNTPLCDTSMGTCAGCNGDNGSGATRQCPTAAAPGCEPTGACGQCSATDQMLCMATTPVCDTSMGTCAACNGDFGSGGTRACPAPNKPACETSGACGQCSATSNMLCTGNTPLCDATSGNCVGCNGDNGSGASHACPGNDPFCRSSGSCGKCMSNTDCVNHPGGPICDTMSGGCTTGCQQDSDCHSDQWCSAAHTCLPKAANGMPVPSAAPLNGQCTPPNGARGCLSAVCDLGDNLCGKPNSRPCSSIVECRSNICDTDNKCGRPNGETCAAALECRTAICDSVDSKCGRLNGETCSATRECRTSGCVGADSKCGLLNGEPCSGASDCRAGVCNADGRCGDPNGTSCQIAATCRSAVCSSSACAPGMCALDADCDPTTFCNASHVCAPRHPSGDACQSGSECASNNCASDHLCGAPDGSACTTAADCRGTSACGGTPSVCKPACSGDGECGKTSYCDDQTSVCLAKMASGPCLKGSQCLSEVCGFSGQCNQPAGFPCGRPTECRTGICDLSGTCTSSCASDRECSGGKFCDSSQQICASVVANSTTCDRPDECSSFRCDMDMKCGEPNGEACGSNILCRSGGCFAGDNMCGSPNGQPCTDPGQCRSGICSSDGMCGSTNGQPCQVGTMCRTGICDSRGVCSSCSTDTDCPNQWCDLGAGVCANPLPNGSACSTPSMCVSKTCASDGICGKLDGDPCSDQSECRSGVCIDGFCGGVVHPQMDAGTQGSFGFAGGGLSCSARHGVKGEGRQAIAIVIFALVLAARGVRIRRRNRD